MPKLIIAELLTPVARALIRREEALVQFAARVVKLAGVPELLHHPMAVELAEPMELLG